MAFTRAKTRSVVGLDIESGFIAAVELSSSGGPIVKRAATETLLPGLFHEGEVIDAEGLAEQLKVFFHDHKLPKRIRLGLASQRVAVRVLELPDIKNDQELQAAVRFQAQEELPMPLEQAVLDHRVLERFNDGETARMRVLVVGARRDSVEHLLAATRKAGLHPELVDLSAFAMVRALYAPPAAYADLLAHPARESSNGNAGATTTNGNGVGADEPYVEGFEESEGTEILELGLEEEPVVEEPVVETEHSGGYGEGEESAVDPAVMYCYVGGGTNLAIAVGTICVFNRVLPNGIESMAATLAERRGLTLDHARQWLRHVGLERDPDTIEGEREIIDEARMVLERGATRMADDVRLSLEYYQAAVSDARRVERMVMAGPGIAVEGLPRAVEAQLGLPVVPRSLGNVQVEPGALDEVDASQLTVAAGLALDEVAA
jgi:Tfp pilus assembly PilM family ATPase